MDSYQIVILDAFTLAQTSVAILAIGTLMILYVIKSWRSIISAPNTCVLLTCYHSIVTHHRRNGQVLTQDQEEMILIGAFGLFWFGKSVFPKEQRNVNSE